MGEKRVRDSAEVGSTAKRHKNGNSNSYGGDKKSQPRPESANWAKKRARTIERRLQRDPDSLPANVHRQLEDELRSLQHDIASHQDKKRRAHMIKKYHMIRFFERKKAMRLAKQLQRRLAETDDAETRARLEADLHIAEVDRLYAIYAPFLEPYVSLYPVEAKGSKETGEQKDKDKKDKDKKDKDKDSASSAAQALHAPRPPLWAEIEAAMGGGAAALKRLQERRPQTAGGRTAKGKAEAETEVPKDKRKDKGKREKQEKNGDEEKEGGDEDGDESDFFYEE